MSLPKDLISPSTTIPAIMWSSNPHNKSIRKKLWEVFSEIFDNDDLMFLHAAERDIAALTCMATVNETVGSIIGDWVNIQLNQLHPTLH